MSFQTFVTQRLAAITEMLNAISANAKKIDDLPTQTNLNPASKIHVSRGGISESLEIQKIIDAISSSNYDQLIAMGEITIDENVVTIPSGGQWLIDEINYGNIAEIERTIPYCATGLERKDILVANTSNDIVLVQGTETAGITFRPNIPLNTVLVTELDVTDSTVSDPTLPVIGNGYVQKNESQDFIINYGAATVIDQVDLYDNRSSLSITNVVTDIKSLNQISTEFIRLGKPFFLKNRSGHDVKLWHNAGTGNIKFNFSDGLDLIIKPNEVLQFSLNASDSSNNRLEFVGIVFNVITLNQYGSHPAFTNQNDLNAWLLGRVTNVPLVPLNAPDGMAALALDGESIKISWNDTNS